MGWLLRCCWLSCLLSMPAAATELRLVTGDNYPPFVGKDLPGGGLLTQIVRAALAQQQLEHSLDWRPWKRGYLMAAQGEYDATFPYIHSPQRDSEFFFSAPIYTIQPHIFSRAGEVFEPDDLAALQGKRLCYPLGWQPPQAIQKMLESGQITRHEPGKLSDCAQLLLLNRDDFFVAHAILGAEALRSTGADLALYRTSTASFPAATLHLLVSRQRPQADELLHSFNHGLTKLFASGEQQRILEQYVQQP